MASISFFMHSIAFEKYASSNGALGEGAEPVANFARGERIALVLLTPACDIQHGDAKRYLFVGGVARPSELMLHKKPTALLTPVLFYDGRNYVVEWDLGTPVTWAKQEARNYVESGTFERVRRFRPLFSLQLQQLFTSRLSRVGTPVIPPVQLLAGVTVSYVAHDTQLRQLTAYGATDRKAVVLVGRDEETFIDRLMLAPETAGEVRAAMQRVAIDDVPQKSREKWKAALENREFFSKMKEGIPYERGGFARAFKNLPYDIVTVIGPYSDKEKSPITPDRKLKGDHGPLILELEIPPAN
jgi:hypothetical protein